MGQNLDSYALNSILIYTYIYIYYFSNNNIYNKLLWLHNLIIINDDDAITFMIIRIVLDYICEIHFQAMIRMDC